MPAEAPAPPVTWNALPMPTTMGWALNSPHQARTPAEDSRSNDTIDNAAVAVADWVVNGTPMTVGVPVPVQTPSEVQPVPLVYPVPLTISVPAAEALDAVEESRS